MSPHTSCRDTVGGDLMPAGGTVSSSRSRHASCTSLPATAVAGRGLSGHSSPVTARHCSDGTTAVTGLLQFRHASYTSLAARPSSRIRGSHGDTEKVQGRVVDMSNVRSSSCLVETAETRKLSRLNLISKPISSGI